MKKAIKIILAFVVLTTTSCKKDESPVAGGKFETVADVSREIVKGYWQRDRTKDSNESAFSNVGWYETNQYFSNNEYDSYYSKNSKVFGSPYKYRVKLVDGKTALVTYSTIADFNNNVDMSSHVHYIVIENSEIKLENKNSKRVIYYKNYKALTDTKDLPPAT